jgi:hypothetical protein
MWSRYSPFRRGIRLFPHIMPIAFPLIFPLGIGLAFWLFHLLFHAIGILLLAALVVFIIRAIQLRSSRAAWQSMRTMGQQRRQPFTSSGQPTPYYQPSAPTGQERASHPYGQGYQPEQPYYRPVAQSNDFEQPQVQYPERMPPMQQ